MSSDLLALNETEKRVYTILSVSGQLSVPELVAGTKLPFDEVTRILEGLLKAGLVRKVPGLVERYAVLLPLQPIAQSLEEKAKEVSAFPQQLTQTIQASLQHVKQELETLLSAIENDKQEHITRGVNTLQSKTTEVKDDVAKDLDAFTKQATETLETNKTMMAEKLKTMQTTINQSLTTIKDTLERLKQDYENHLTSFTSTASKKTQETITSLPQEPSVMQNLPDLETTFLTTEEKEFTQHKAFLDSSFNDMLKNYEQILASLHSALDQVSLRIDETTKNTSSWKAEAETILKAFKADVDEAITKAHQLMKQEIQGSTEKFMDLNKKKTESMESLKAMTNEFVTTELKTIETSKQTIDKGIINLSDTVKTKVTAISEEWGNVLSNEVVASKTLEQAFKNNFDALITELVTELTGKSKQLYESFSSSFQQELEKSKESKQNIIQNTVQSLHEDIESLKQQLTTELTQLNENMKLEFQKVKDEFLKQLDSQGEINAHYESEEKRVLEALENTLENMKTEFLALMNKTNETILTGITKHSETLNQTMTSLKDVTTQTITNNEQTITGATDSLKTKRENVLQELDALHTSLQESIKTSFETMKTTLLKEHAQTQQAFKELLEGFVQSLEHLKTTNTQAMQDVIVEGQARLDQNQASIEEHVQQETTVLTSVIKQLQDELVTFQSQATEKVTSVFDEGVKRLETVLQGALDSFVQKMKETMNKNYEDLENNMTGTLRSASEITEQINTVTLNLAKNLNELSTGQEREEPVKIMTASIIGDEAIKEYMKSMVHRVKRGITFLSPNKSMIPVKEILTLPMTAQVTVVTRIDKTTDRDWVKQLYKAKANVIIRQLTERSGSGTLPDFIGCEREGEEILLGTIDEDSKETVAIVSMSAYFTKILGNIVIAEYSRGRSMQLQRSEFE